MKNKCPNCDSENTVKCSVVYQTGTTTGSFGGIGVDLQGDVGGFGGITSSQTLLAQTVSPPKAPSSSPVGMVLLIIGGALIFFSLAYYSVIFAFDRSRIWGFVLIIGVLIVTCGLVVLSIDHSSKAKLHSFALIKWGRQWVCLRCGTRFEPRLDDV